MLKTETRNDGTPARGSISRTVAESRVAFSQRVGERGEWVGACGRYSVGLTAGQPPRVRNRVFQQVAGLLCLVGAETSLRSRVGATLARSLTASVRGSGLRDVRAW
jgi:hypothetical protein